MSSTLSLDEVPENVKVKVIAINAGFGLSRRLYEMGIIPGVEIQVIHKDRSSIIIQVLNTNLVLSRGIAKKIFVQLIP